MSTTPDPKIVREIAEDAMRGAIHDNMFWHVNQAVIEHGVPGPASKGSTFEVHRSAAIAEYKRMADALDRPDERDGVREQIALDLERTSNSLDQDAERYADERSPLLQAQAEALWDAAQRIRSGATLDAHDANGAKGGE